MNRGLLQRTGFIVALILINAFVLARVPLRLGLDLRGGASLILRVKVEGGSVAQRRDVVEQTRQILIRRINAYGLAEAPVQPYGSRGNELLVQLPGVNDPARIRNLLQSRAVLEWYSVEGGPFTNRAEAMAQYSGVLPPGDKLVATRPLADAQRTWYLVNNRPVIRGTDLRDARVGAGNPQAPVTTFTLAQDAAIRFEQYTRAHINQRSAIVLDDEILSAPVIEDVIRDSGQIRGARTVAEAQDLAIDLKSGALPAAIEIIQERTVEASLGADSIRHGMQAAVAGLARGSCGDADLLPAGRRECHARADPERGAAARHAGLLWSGADAAGHRRRGTDDRHGGGQQRSDLRTDTRRAALRKDCRQCARKRLLEGIRDPGRHACHDGRFVRVPVFLWNSGGSRFCRDARDRADYQSVHVRVCFEGGIRLGIVAAGEHEPTQYRSASLAGMAKDKTRGSAGFSA